MFLENYFLEVRFERICVMLWTRLIIFTFIFKTHLKIQTNRRKQKKQMKKIFYSLLEILFFGTTSFLLIILFQKTLFYLTGLITLLYVLIYSFLIFKTSKRLFHSKITQVIAGIIVVLGSILLTVFLNSMLN